MWRGAHWRGLGGCRRCGGLLGGRRHRSRDLGALPLYLCLSALRLLQQRLVLLLELCAVLLHRSQLILQLLQLLLKRRDLRLGILPASFATSLQAVRLVAVLSPTVGFSSACRNQFGFPALP